MSQMRLGALEATLAGAAKSLRCPAITFHLRHYGLLEPDPSTIAGEGGLRLVLTQRPELTFNYN
jgi:hypothetical protein